MVRACISSFLLIAWGVAGIAQPSDHAAARALVVFAPDPGGQLNRRNAEDVLQRLSESDAQFQQPALRRTPPVAGQYFLPAGPTDISRFPPEHPRAKLDRTVVLAFSSEAAADAAVIELRLDSTVEYATRTTTGVAGFQSSPCSGNTTRGPSDPILGDVVEVVNPPAKTYAQTQMRLPQAHALSEGHTYIALVDNGIDSVHQDLIDFQGNTHVGGSYHPHLGFVQVKAPTQTGPFANPYEGFVVFGAGDEYLIPRTSIDPLSLQGCDDNNDWLYETQAAGHGTHVAGLAAANRNGLGIDGACPSCPLLIGKATLRTSCYARVDTENGITPYDTHTSPNSDNSHARAEVFDVLDTSGVYTFAAIGFAVDLGVQVINLSLGEPGLAGDFCASNASHPFCLVIDYADKRDVIFVSAAGNFRNSDLNFPANDPRVLGIGGVDANKSRWLVGSDPNCGSPSESDPDYGPSFAAPADRVYGTMYPDLNWNASACHEWNDGVRGDSYGYCTGTSMSSPLVAGTAALVRSANPLATKQHVEEALKASTGSSVYHSSLGYGVPQGDVAVKDMLGRVSGTQVRNRLTPLFGLQSTNVTDRVYTTKPQVALSFTFNVQWDYQPIGAVVLGYSFREHSSNQTLPTPRADFFVFTMADDTGLAGDLTPLFRMRKWPYAAPGYQPISMLALESELSSRHYDGFELEGVEGYIYKPCSPEPSCIPTGAMKILRGYHVNRSEYAVFPSSEASMYNFMGFATSTHKVLGYAYKNLNADGDQLIDGLELVIGTNRLAVDSDGDGSLDHVEYPLSGRPVCDPMISGC